MKLALVIAVFASVTAVNAFASAGATYQCGEYTVELLGPDQTTVYDAKGEEVMSASLEEFSPLVTKKNKTVLRLAERDVACKLKSDKN